MHLRVDDGNSKVFLHYLRYDITNKIFKYCYDGYWPIEGKNHKDS